ncbi:MAG TPA: ATP-grasp domain-containing protein [Tepidisphaeraceae bacterium]|jgi:D-alanine-D-alanine ligase|nr:ATP-grasp domain-containing protein [Tepidisphaeraceae bacterium]
MRKLRVLVMMDELLVPPDSVEGLSVATTTRFRTEYDVLSTLRAMGHIAEPCGVKSDLGVIVPAIEEFQPHVCFNLIEDFDGVATHDQHVVSYLELLKQPYTGCNPRGLTIARDKAIAKKILAYHGINVPQFQVFHQGRAIRPVEDMIFPAIVKSLTEEGSTGISQASIVNSHDEMAERVTFIHEKLNTAAIVEQYIDGRELYVGVIGNAKVTALPIWELNLANLPDDSARIATSKVKWDVAYQERYDIHSGLAKDLSAEQEDAIVDDCKHIYRLLGLSGYARLDLRLTADGQVYFLEANPNPQIACGEDFADSAQQAGLSYELLLHKIITLGMSYHPMQLAA